MDHITQFPLTPTNGIALIDPIDGNWSYTPHPHFFGNDNFTISLTDDLNQSYYGDNRSFRTSC